MQAQNYTRTDKIRWTISLLYSLLISPTAALLAIVWNFLTLIFLILVWILSSPLSIQVSEVFEAIVHSWKLLLQVDEIIYIEFLNVSTAAQNLDLINNAKPLNLILYTLCKVVISSVIGIINLVILIITVLSLYTLFFLMLPANRLLYTIQYSILRCILRSDKDANIAMLEETLEELEAESHHLPENAAL